MNTEPQETDEDTLAEAWIKAYTPKVGGLSGGTCRSNG